MSKWAQQYDVNLQEQEERPRRLLPHENTRTLLRHPFLSSPVQESASGQMWPVWRSQELWLRRRPGRLADTQTPLGARLPCSSLFLSVMFVLLSVGMYLPRLCLRKFQGRHWPLFQVVETYLKNLLGISGTVLLFCLRCWPLVLCPFFQLRATIFNLSHLMAHINQLLELHHTNLTKKIGMIFIHSYWTAIVLAIDIFHLTI